MDIYWGFESDKPKNNKRSYRDYKESKIVILKRLSYSKK